MAWHSDDWKQIDKPTAKAIIELCGLHGITWSTLDSRWYFREIEWSDDTPGAWVFPGRHPVLIHSFTDDEIYVSPDLLTD